MSAPKLRPYQLASLDAIYAALKAGTNRVLIKKPTGTGKTVTFAAMPEHFKPWLSQFPERERKMLVIAHREELLDQAAAKIIAQNPHARVGVEQADRVASPHCDVVVASIQTLTATKCRRLKRLLGRHRFRLVIVDEAHHAAAASYRTALALLGFLPMADATDDENVEAATYDDVEVMRHALKGWDAIAPKDQLLVGVTATPNRSDAIGLGCVFQTIAYSYDLKRAIEDKWLVPIVPWVIETTTSLDSVRTTAGEFNQKDLADEVNTPYRNQLAVAGWQEHASEESTLAFTVDVAHAHDLAQAFCDAGVVARPLSGKTPKDERRELLAAYTRGDVQVLTNCMVLTEGTDLPRTGCILHAKPTKSATLYEQMTGRGLRIHPGKERCIVLDIVDIARKHSLQTSPVLYGLPPGLKTQGEDLREVEDLLAKFKEKHPGANLDGLGRFTLEQLNAHAKTFDIWTVREMGDYGRGLDMRWIRSDDEAFNIEYPWQDMKERMTVERNLLGRFEVRLTQHSMGAPSYAVSNDRVLATDIEHANTALKLAEAFVTQERGSVKRLKDNNAPWRKNPASEKQLNLLRRRKVPFRQGLTAGEASDLIDLAFARRG
jgi:superfamily II DNA or RNA helicase